MLIEELLDAFVAKREKASSSTPPSTRESQKGSKGIQFVTTAERTSAPHQAGITIRRDSLQA